MSYSKSNAAYDFSSFLPEQQVEEIEKKKVPVQKKKVVKSKVSVKPATVVKWVFVSAFVMISLLSIMIGNINITKQNDEISKAQKSLSTAQSEQVSLNSKLESRMSMQKVENYAVNKLGLVKIQPFQIEYVHLNGTDKVEVSNDNFLVFGFFKNIADSIMEYFS